MSQNSPKIKKKASILICGSQDLTDKNFVFLMLSTVNTTLKNGGSQIGEIYTSRFSGACKFAKTWVTIHNENCSKEERIAIKEHQFDLHLESKGHSFFEEVDIPLPVLKSDEFYKKGQEQLISTGVNMVMAFPNNTGKMGASTANIKRFALLANVRFLNCADAYRTLQQKALEEASKVAKENKERHAANKGFKMAYQEAEEETIQITQPVLANRRSFTR